MTRRADGHRAKPIVVESTPFTIGGFVSCQKSSDTEIRVQGSGFRVQGLGCRVYGHAENR